MYVIKNEQGEYWNGRMVEPDTTPDIQKAQILTFKPEHMCKGEKAVEVEITVKEKI